MKLSMTTLALSACFMAGSLSASDFVVVSATGVVAPESLQAGQKLAAGTRLELAPWGRAVIRETGKCTLTHVVVGVGDHQLTPSEDCTPAEEPMMVVARIQQGDTFAASLDEAAEGPAKDVVMALSHDPCVYLPRVSEENVGGVECPSGYALNGLRCSGNFCDNKDLMCCPYLDGASDPEAKQIPARQISEEFPNTSTSKKFFNGMTCYGPYCDNVLPGAFKSPRLNKTKTCQWSAWDSEQPSTWLVCGADQFVSGMRCRADYCGDVGIQCCEAKVE